METTQDFKLTSPDETTIFCDIDLLNKSYEKIITHLTMTDLQGSDDLNDRVFLNNLIECFDDDFCKQCLEVLPDDVLSYLMPKIRYLLTSYEKIEEFIIKDAKHQENYFEHEDNISNIFEMLTCDKESFDCRETITNILKDMNSSLTDGEVESEILSKGLFKDEIINQYGSLSGATIAYMTEDEVESQLDVSQILGDLELTLDLASFQFIFEKLKQEFYIPSDKSIKSLTDSFEQFIPIGKIIAFYTTEDLIKTAINNLTNKE